MKKVTKIDKIQPSKAAKRSSASQPTAEFLRIRMPSLKAWKRR